MDITTGTPIHFVEARDHGHENWTVDPHYLFLSAEAAEAWIDAYNAAEDTRIAAAYEAYGEAVEARREDWSPLPSKTFAQWVMHDPVSGRRGRNYRVSESVGEVIA